MRLEELTCNSCGAPLEVPETANFVTCNHCSKQLAVRRTEDVTYTETLGRLAQQTEELTERLDDLSSHHQVEALDREWELEREKYMITHKNGSRDIPTEGGAIGNGVVATVFGAIWTSMTLGMPSQMPGAVRVLFPLIGVMIIVGGIFASISTYQNAEKYRNAERRYRSRREDLTGTIED